MNIQEIIGRAIYEGDYEHAKWEDQSEEIQLEYKSIAVNIVVALANNRLHITTIPDIPDDLSPPAKDGRSKH